MGLGSLYLIAKGRDDLYIVQDPDITYFKLVYKKHTNFSIESIDQYFKTIPDFGRKVTLNVSKNADLMGNIYLKVILPSILLIIIQKLIILKNLDGLIGLGLL